MTRSQMRGQPGSYATPVLAAVHAAADKIKHQLTHSAPPRRPPPQTASCLWGVPVVIAFHVAAQAPQQCERWVCCAGWRSQVGCGMLRRGMGSGLPSELPCPAS